MTSKPATGTRFTHARMGYTIEVVGTVQDLVAIRTVDGDGHVEVVPASDLATGWVVA